MKEIVYVCPRCKGLLLKKENHYFCSSDQLSFPRTARNGIELVILNEDIAEDGNCECIIDGKQKCNIVMNKLIAENY